MRSRRRSLILSLVVAAILCETAKVYLLLGKFPHLLDALQHLPLKREDVEDVVAVQAVGWDEKLRERAFSVHLDADIRVHRRAVWTDGWFRLQLEFDFILCELLQRLHAACEKLLHPSLHFRTRGS